MSFCSVVNRKSWFTNLQSWFLKFWLFIGFINGIILLIRLGIVWRSKGDFFTSKELSIVFAIFDGAAAVVTLLVFSTFHQDITKLRLWLKFTTLFLILEALITGITGIFVIQKDNTNENVQFYFNTTIVSTVVNGLFLTFLSLRSWYVGTTHIYLSYDSSDQSVRNRVYKIRDELIGYGIIPCSIEDRGNEVNKSTVHGIINSKLILLFVSESYCNKLFDKDVKEPCKYEFQLASVLSKRCLIIYMDEISSRKRKTEEWIAQNPNAPDRHDLTIPVEFLALIQNTICTSAFVDHLPDELQENADQAKRASYNEKMQKFKEGVKNLAHAINTRKYSASSPVLIYDPGMKV